MTEVGIVGLAAVSALGRGTRPQLDGVLGGAAAFAPVRRFDVGDRRVKVAATLPDAGRLRDELADAADAACREAGLTPSERATTPLMLAVHADPDAPRAPGHGPARPTAAELAGEVSSRVGLGAPTRVYTSACVSGSTAVADAAVLISHGRVERVVVAGGYLVEPDQYALFDAGRALAADGVVRPFSADRSGLLLGDGVAAVVLESVTASRIRGRTEHARVAGWGRAGDGYHPCQPHPEGRGLARAIEAALRRAALTPDAVGYINANGTGTDYSDAAEAAALHRALGVAAGRIPVSSTKGTHGHALEGSGLLELVVTVLALRAGRLPVNAGFLAADAACRLDLIVDSSRPTDARYALSLNAAFGGANTALVVEAA